jgi:hypothetical protein
MADDVVLNPGVAGDTVRSIDKTGKQAQVVVLDLGGAGAESLLTTTLPVSATQLPASLGSKADSASLAVTQSTEDKAVLAALSAKLPATLGSKADSASLAVTQSTEDKAVQAAIAAVAGTTSGAAVTTDATGTIQQYLRGIITKMVAQLPASLGAKAASASLAVTGSTEDSALMGSLTETAPASDTASSGQNGRLQRIAQRLTSLIALVPASLGSKAAASAFAVTDSTEDIARMGIITETAPGTDTASSGLNGRLQRIAQRLSTLISGGLPVTTLPDYMQAFIPETRFTNDTAATSNENVTTGVTSLTGTAMWIANESVTPGELIYFKFGTSSQDATTGAVQVVYPGTFGTFQIPTGTTNMAFASAAGTPAFKYMRGTGSV